METQCKIQNIDDDYYRTEISGTFATIMKDT